MDRRPRGPLGGRPCGAHRGPVRRRRVGADRRGRWPGAARRSADGSGGGAGHDVDPPARPDMRASDADRTVVAERLQTALDEGRLSLTEYDERLQQTYAARTYGDLDA